MRRHTLEMCAVCVSVCVCVCVCVCMCVLLLSIEARSKNQAHYDTIHIKSFFPLVE